MRACVTIVAFVCVLAGCGTSGGEKRHAGTSTDRGSSRAASRINKCVDRLLSRATTNGGSEQQVRRYVQDTYCVPFEQNAWVYEDGALSIAAQRWLDNAGECAASSEPTPTGTVPCAPTSRPGHAGTRSIDCALLHHVRRTEVRAYMADQQRAGEVHCDDGTPLGDLGVP